MKIFTKHDSRLNPIVDKYKLEREVPRISMSIEYNGNKYRELVFNAASLLGKSKNIINGLIFLDENNNVVSDKKKQRELSGIFFNLEQLLEDSFIKNLSKAIITENNLKIEEARVDFYEANLMLLNNRNVYGADKINEIIKLLPNLKRENNEAIQNFIDKVNEFKDAEFIKNDVLMFEIKPLYEETLMKNFEKIKLIGTGRNYYGDVKKEALKLFKRRLFGSMGNKMEGSASGLEYELNYLMHVVSVYEQIISMSNSEYIKYLNDMEKEHIKEMIDKNRA